MTSSQIVLLVVAILLSQLAFWIPVLRWLSRKLERMSTELRDELGADTIVLGPEPAIYRGSTGGFSKLKGNGVAALTTDKLVIAKAVGERIELDLDEVTGVREAKWFAGSNRGGRMHLIVQAGEGRELGLFVEKQRAWVKALRERAGLDRVEDDGEPDPATETTADP